MKILDYDKIYQYVEFELGDREGWFELPSKDAVLRDSDGNNMHIGKFADYDNTDQPVIDWCANITADGKYYALMDSTTQNPNGTWNFYEATSGLRGMTYTQERQSVWQDNFGTVVSHEEMKEIRRISAMTLDEYKVEIISNLEKEKNAVDFEIEVSSNVRGEELQYKLNLKSYSELGTQIEDAVTSGTGYIAWHDNSCLSHDLVNPYTIEQASTIFFLAKQEVGRRDATYDIYKLRTDAMEEKFSKQEIIDMEMTPEHQSYIDTIVDGIRL